MTPEQAIERVERVSLSTRFRCDRTDSSIQRCGECSDCRDSAALRIVLELAKRPYALGEGEREELRECLRIARYQRDTTEASDSRDLYVRRIKALTAALSLASPFTEKEAEALKAYVEFGEANELCLEDDPHGLLDDAPEAHELIAKLDAMLEDK